MSDMIATMEPAAESFQQMVTRCDAPEGGIPSKVANVGQSCDIASITATCSHLDEDIATASSMDALCDTPCVHLVVESFDACNADPSTQVRSQFGAEQWQPVVTQCQQLAFPAGKREKRRSQAVARDKDSTHHR